LLFLCNSCTDIFHLSQQALQAHAVTVAQKYKENHAEWMDAARTLRSPYWDWASNIIPPDEVIRKEELEIEKPEGVKPVKNPLYAYKFHPIDSSFAGNFAKDDTTVRNPQRGAPSPRASRPDALVECVFALCAAVVSPC
jgi:tyrosinase